MIETAISELTDVLNESPPSAIAVSGGVDSMTLATFAGRLAEQKFQVFHALSPAVPNDATERVRTFAHKENWQLYEINAGEFEDPNYRENPVNRCYYCKLNLYRAISNHTERVIFSGTNLDDLNDYRPGLEAARGHGVRHPFIEAGIEKDSVRAIANYLNLKSLAELPASPCLSSRIETGIRIESEQLTLIDAIEKFVINRLNPSTVRCRFRKKEIVIELGTEDIELLNDKIQNELRTVISAMLESDGITKPLRFQPYKMGSAFLRRVNNG